MSADGLLPIALSAGVPPWIARVRRLTLEQRHVRAAELAQVIAERGDSILFRGSKDGETAATFNALAEGLAIAALQPGGVTAFGSHWCTAHAACLAAERAALEVAS